MVDHGLLKDEEAEHLVHDIQHNLDLVMSCREEDHPDTRQSDRRATIIADRKSILAPSSGVAGKPALIVPLEVLEEGMSDSSTSSDSPDETDLPIPVEVEELGNTDDGVIQATDIAKDVQEGFGDQTKEIKSDA